MKTAVSYMWDGTVFRQSFYEKEGNRWRIFSPTLEIRF